MINRFQYLQELSVASPNDTFLLFALAKECEKLQKPLEAMAYYLLLKAVDPNYVGLYYHLGKLYETQKDDTLAVETYKKGIEICKIVGDRHAASELSGALLNLVDPDE
jgi:tetratricopeptide (TPR) repeat protein